MSQRGGNGAIYRSPINVHVDANHATIVVYFYNVAATFDENLHISRSCLVMDVVRDACMHEGGSFEGVSRLRSRGFNFHYFFTFTFTFQFRMNFCLAYSTDFISLSYWPCVPLSEFKFDLFV